MSSFDSEQILRRKLTAEQRRVKLLVDVLRELETRIGHTLEVEDRQKLNGAIQVGEHWVREAE